MAHFTFQGDRISGKTMSVGKDIVLSIGLSGPMNTFVTPSEELEVTANPSIGIVTVTKSSEPIKNTIRIWEIKGIVPGTTKLEAKTRGEVWDSITVNVVDNAQVMFIQNLFVEAADIALKFKLPISIMIAQACLESDFGRNPRARTNNTLYGITKRSELSQGKERDWYPTCRTIILSPTLVDEKIDGVKTGKLKLVNDRFCGAVSFREAVQIWGEYVTHHPRTKKNLFIDPPWSDAHLRAIGELMKGIGFGSKVVGDYTHELMRIIDNHKLRQFDPK
jgi:hypothetical protein